MPTFQDVYNIVDGIAPFSLAESWDNVGLLIGSQTDQTDKILVALDATDAVIDEAIEQGASLIITHHPVIYDPLKRIESQSIAYRLIAAGIGVISAHTNLDIAKGGVNDALARRLGLWNLCGLSQTGKETWYRVAAFVPLPAVQKVYEAMTAAGAGTRGNYSGCAFLVEGEGRFHPEEGANPYIGSVGRTQKVPEVRIDMVIAPEKLPEVVKALRQTHPYEEPAFDVTPNYGCMTEHFIGRVGDLPHAMAPEDFAEYVKERLGIGGIRYTAGAGEIKTVAVCGGSGADFLPQALALGAQALVIGECRHRHLLQAGRMGMTLVDAGHHATESVVLEPLAAQLREQLGDVPVLVAESDGDGVHYR